MEQGKKEKDGRRGQGADCVCEQLPDEVLQDLEDRGIKYIP